MTLSIWQADQTQPVREVDVLVIGAGIIGTAAAYFARQAGHEVVMTDMRDLAMGASGRNAGFMITGLDTYYHHARERYGAALTRDIWEVSQRSIAYWKQWAAGGSVPVEVCGSLLLAESPEEADDLRQAASAMQADGIGVTFHARDPLERGYYAAIEQPWDGAVQPYKLARAIFDQSGAELIPNNEVYRIEQTGTQTVTVHSHRTIFQARHVLLCTNAYSPQLHPYFKGKITPTRAQVLVTEPLPRRLLDHIGYSNYGYMYYRMTFDQRLLLGGARHRFMEMEHDTTEDRINDHIQAALDNYLRERFPETIAPDGSLPIHRRWTGIMGFAADGIPLVGRLPDAPGVVFAAGFTGHGLSLGAGVAERAVNLALRGEHPGVFDAARLE